mgnify:CR=1 FL=1
MNLKIGQEIDGKTIHKISMDEETRDMTVWLTAYELYPINGVHFDTLTVKHNESIEKVLNHKWEK